MIRGILLALIALFFATSAEAKHKYQALHPLCNVVFPCTPMEGQRVMGPGLFDGIRSINVTMHRIRHAALRAKHERQVGVPRFRSYRYANNVVEHPAGCPRYLFCGCGAQVEIFHTATRIYHGLNLYLADTWRRHFPRASGPGYHIVLARSGHVMVLRSQVEGDTWTVYDANSGRGLTRVHEISLSHTLRAGYVMVDPHTLL